MQNKVIVFGGTGDVGQIIVQKLIAQNYEVSVLTRQAKKSTENLRYIVGNVLEPVVVDASIEKNDRVIVALGFNDSDQDTMSRGTANVISAMKNKGAKRLVCLSAQGVGDSWHYMPDEFKEMVLDNAILKASFLDHGVQEDILKKSNLEGCEYVIKCT